MSPRVYSSSRDRILDAAERLILERGGGQLSVEDVAAEAQVSKGGFFHHFATKDELLIAVVDRLVEGVDGQVNAIAAKDPEPRGARLRAQIALAFDMDEAGFKKVIALLLAVIKTSGQNPAFIQRGRQMNAATFARDVAEDIPLGRAIAIQYALDGYAIGHGLLGGLGPREKAALRDSLMALARPEANPPPRPLKKGRKS
jgi:AcrR family transcriptional regulator